MGAYIPYRKTYFVLATEDRVLPTWQRLFGPFAQKQQAEDYIKNVLAQKSGWTATRTAMPPWSRAEVIEAEDAFRG